MRFCESASRRKAILIRKLRSPTRVVLATAGKPGDEIVRLLCGEI